MLRPRFCGVLVYFFGFNVAGFVYFFGFNVAGFVYFFGFNVAGFVYFFGFASDVTLFSVTSVLRGSQPISDSRR